MADDSNSPEKTANSGEALQQLIDLANAKPAKDDAEEAVALTSPESTSETPDLTRANIHYGAEFKSDGAVEQGQAAAFLASDVTIEGAEEGEAKSAVLSEARSEDDSESAGNGVDLAAIGRATPGSFDFAESEAEVVSEDEGVAPSGQTAVEDGDSADTSEKTVIAGDDARGSA